MSDEKRVDEQGDNSRTTYQELCNSYRAIDDFRAKLLGFLPLATGTGIFLLISNLKVIQNLAGETDGQTLTAETTKSFLWAAGAFGFAITLGLFFYELYGIKKCHALINAGRKLEEHLGIDAQGGQFTKRPREVARLINEPLAAAVIYPAVLAAWTFIALFLKSQQGARGWAISVFSVGFAVSFFFNLKLKMEEDIRDVLGITEEKKDELTIGDVWDYLKIKARSEKSRRKKPNISQRLVELLNVISPDLQMGPQDRKIMEELKDRMNKLGLENRNPSKQDWQDLGQLAERLRQAHANNQ
jgi:hypothetical protein